jgi:hypothetical protein
MAPSTLCSNWEALWNSYEVIGVQVRYFA